METKLSKSIHRIATLYFFIVALSTSFSSFAQKSEHPEAINCDEAGYCWGEKKEEAKMKYTFYSDRFDWGEKYWSEAEEPLTWLVENTPCLHESMYINGYKVLNSLIKKAKKDKESDERISELEDKILKLLDNRYKYFGNSKKVLVTKGSKAYPYLRDRGKEYHQELFDLYTNLYEINGNESKRYNLKYYMAVIATMKIKNEISEDSVFTHYEKIMGVIDYQIANETDKEKLGKWKEAGKSTEELLVKVTDINCELVDRFFAEKLKASPDNGDLNKRAFNYYALAKCYDNPNFILAAKGSYDSEPTAGLASIIAKSFVSEKNFSEASKWYENAIELSKDAPDKAAGYCMDYAKVLSKEGKYSQARQHARKAAELDPETKSEAYSFIGSLYMNSGNLCKNVNPVKQRAIYLAAYDAYAIAGNNKGMARAKEQFPSKTEMFTNNMEEGSTIEVGCWIGGTTTLRRR